MPRYHFDLREGDAFAEDEEGVELSDIESAQIEAAGSLSDMVKELAVRGATEPLGHPMSVEVRDSQGSLFRLSFTFNRRMH